MGGAGSKMQLPAPPCSPNLAIWAPHGLPETIAASWAGFSSSGKQGRQFLQASVEAVASGGSAVGSWACHVSLYLHPDQGVMWTYCSPPPKGQHLNPGAAV